MDIQLFGSEISRRIAVKGYRGCSGKGFSSGAAWAWTGGGCGVGMGGQGARALFGAQAGDGVGEGRFCGAPGDG